MKKENFSTGFVSEYKNNGQALEQEFRYKRTGLIMKADNLKATEGCDLEGYSIKSARATICKGTDLIKHLEQDKATGFIYLTRTKIAYIMNKNEYIDFVSTFGTIDTDSKKNNGGKKIRLGRETSKMLQWLEERA